MRTKEQIEALKTSETAGSETRKYAPGQNPNSLEALKPTQWKPGQSGNPGGRKTDMAQQIARAVFEQNPELIYQAFVKALSKGGAFAYQVLGDRAYGKLKETREIGLEYNELPDDQLQGEIERIMQRIGLAHEVDRATEAGVATARAEKTNGHAQDTHVLPGNGSVKA